MGELLRALTELSRHVSRVAVFAPAGEPQGPVSTRSVKTKRSSETRAMPRCLGLELAQLGADGLAAKDWYAKGAGAAPIARPANGVSARTARPGGLTHVEGVEEVREEPSARARPSLVCLRGYRLSAAEHRKVGRA